MGRARLYRPHVGQDVWNLGTHHMTTAPALYSERELAWFASEIGEPDGTTVRLDGAPRRPMIRAATSTTTVESAEVDWSADWLPDALGELARIRKLAPGWHSCDAAPPNDIAINIATHVLI